MRVDKCRESFCVVQSHDTLHDDTQHNSIQPIDHNRKKQGTQHNDTQHESLDASYCCTQYCNLYCYAECWYAECRYAECHGAV